MGSSLPAPALRTPGQDTAGPRAARDVEEVKAADSAAVLEALRVSLHRLVVEERLAPWQICVLTGVPPEA